jgi:hypothetical protein
MLTANNLDGANAKKFVDCGMGLVITNTVGTETIIADLQGKLAMQVFREQLNLKVSYYENHISFMLFLQEVIGIELAPSRANVGFEALKKLHQFITT